MNELERMRKEKEHHISSLNEYARRREAKMDQRPLDIKKRSIDKLEVDLIDLTERLEQAQDEVVQLKKELLAERRMHLKELYDNDDISEDDYIEAILELEALQKALAGSKDVSP